VPLSTTRGLLAASISRQRRAQAHQQAERMGMRRLCASAALRAEAVGNLYISSLQPPCDSLQVVNIA